MRIKKYTQFIKESSEYKYGCVMIETPFPNWNDITSMISPEDLYDREEGDAIQENPHLTIFYGLHSNVKTEVVEDIFREFKGNIKIEGNGISIFENELFDVVKFNINSQGSLQSLFNEFMKLPNSCTYPDYQPHITIAYVKSGTGKKYVKPDYKYEVKNVDKITYSMADGDKINFEYTK